MEKKNENKKVVKEVGEVKKTTKKTAIAVKKGASETKVTAEKKVSAVKKSAAVKPANKVESTEKKATKTTAKKSTEPKKTVKAVEPEKKVSTKKTTKTATEPVKKSTSTDKVKKTTEATKKVATKKTSAASKTEEPVKKTVKTTSASNKTASATKKATTSTKTAVKKTVASATKKVSSEKSGSIKVAKDSKTKAVSASTKKKVADKINLSTDKSKSTARKVMKKNVDEYEKDLGMSFIEEELDDSIDMNDLNKKLKDRKKVSQKEGVTIFKNSFYNLIFAFIFILFLVFCNYGFYNIEKNAMIANMHLFSFMFLGVALILIETAYKEDKGTKAINGIETLLMGILTLALPFVLQKYTDQYIKTLLISGIVIFVYYVIKSIVVFFLRKRDAIREKDDIAKENDEDDEIEDDDEFDD